MNISPIVSEILKKRGISGQKGIEEFLSDKPQLTYDPFLLSGMKEGVDFVLSAVEREDMICIYGDYDVDGTTATALLYNFLKELTNNITYYIPSRFEEGYGLNNESLAKLKEEGIDTIITVDCGAVSRKEVDHAKSIGLNIMITDHHNMEEATAPECIVINPKNFDSKYPFSGLCGCAVAFKLVQAIVKTAELDRSNLTKPLDLVAIATVADVVPLIDENRTMVKYGLRELNKGSRKALRIMMDKLELTPGSIDSYKIGFIIGPHMNAAGRMSDANAVVKMLISDDNKEISDIVDMLINHNIDRRAVQDKCFDECVEIIDREYKDALFIMVKPPSIHEGIAGIVAGKIRELYNRPAIVLSESKDESGNLVLKGSGRSMGGIDLIKMLLTNEELFIKLGGHAMAAGFTLPEGNEDILMDRLSSSMENELKKNPDLFTASINPDAVISESDIDMELVKELKLMAPFGVENPRPVLMLEDVIIKNIKYMGSDNQHVKFKCGTFDFVLFGAAKENKDLLSEGKHAIIYGSPDINTWMGRDSIQFIVKTMDGREGDLV